MYTAGWLSRGLRGLLVRVLRALDRLPQHVGIVMDGNRRFARQRGEAIKDGHTSGFEAMSRVLDIAYAVGIREVTVYAFSIENFHRSAGEVADLMDIARKRLGQLAARGDVAETYGVRINVLGRLELLPPDVQALARQVMAETAGNTHATLNLCMPYTARDDMAQALAQVAAGGGASGDLSGAAAIDEITAHLYTRSTPPLDLVVRTSDTTRLSDFLLWETTSDTYIDFVPQLWPAYTPWKFVCSLMRWRVSRPCQMAAN